MKTKILIALLLVSLILASCVSGIDKRPIHRKTPTPTKTLIPSSTPTSIPSPTPTPLPPEIFGVMMPMDFNGMMAAAQINPAYYRNIMAVFADKPLSCPSCDAAKAAGYQLLITIRANNNALPVTNLVAYSNFIDGIVQQYYPWGIVIKNEESSMAFYSGNILQYSEQLEAACIVARNYNIKCMNGGLASKMILLLMWQDKYNKSCDFAQHVFGITEAIMLCNGGNATIQGYINRTRDFYNLYKTADIDYVNFHFYVEQTQYGTNVNVFNDVIQFMKAIGKPVLINEWGLRLDDTVILIDLMGMMRAANIPVAIYFSPYASPNYNVSPLQNIDGSLTDMGLSFRYYLIGH